MIQTGRWIYSFRPLLAKHLPSYLALNVFFYGSIGLGMLIVLEHPEIQSAFKQLDHEGVQNHGWSLVVGAYQKRHILRAACLTFAVNLVVGTIVLITLPSLFIPFIGIAMGMCRALLWGIVYGPGCARNVQLLVAPLMLLEGQGYVLGMFGVYLHGKAAMMPSTVGATRRMQGYKHGLVQSLRIYPLTALILAISALFEATEIILAMHPSVSQAAQIDPFVSQAQQIDNPAYKAWASFKPGSSTTLAGTVADLGITMKMTE